jgi:phage tail-like protein
LLNENDHIKIGPFELAVEKIEIPQVEEAPITPEEGVVAEGVPEILEELSIPTTPPPPPSEEDLILAQPPEEELVPLGLTIKSQRLINYLPGIYHTDFMSRFLGIFEAILTPVEWNINNFDLFLSPQTCPSAFIPWLANWFEVVFDDTWSEGKRRNFLQEAHKIYAMRGTKKALSRTLEIYTGSTPEIDDLAEDLEPHTFRVTLPIRESDIRRANIEMLINAHKPAHTAYELHFQE